MAMKELPLVTIITPTYNRASFLSETLDSVLNQGYPNLEYIVIDDGSTDDTAEVLRRYDRRVAWLRTPNGGESMAVNRGFAMARGEFVVVVNSDDPLLPGMIPTTVSFLQTNPDCLVAYPDWLVIDQHSRPLSVTRARDYDYGAMVRDWGCYPGPGAMLRRRALELEPGRDLRFKYVADFEYWLRLGLHGPFARIPATLATHRHHENSAGVAKAHLIAREIRALHAHYFRTAKLPSEVRRLRRASLSSAHFEAGSRMIDRMPLCNPFMKRSVALDPDGGFHRFWELLQSLEAGFASLRWEVLPPERRTTVPPSSPLFHPQLWVASIERVRALEEARDQAESQVQSLRTRLAEEVASFSGRDRTLAEEAQGLRSRVACLMSEGQGLRHQVASLADEGQGLRGQVARLADECRGLREHLACMDERARALREKLTAHEASRWHRLGARLAGARRAYRWARKACRPARRIARRIAAAVWGGPGRPVGMFR